MINPQVRPSDSDRTRHSLILAAEGLFAESGIDGVSLRQINIAAGQKNNSAAHYHFGTKDTLILAIYNYRMAHVNERRVTMLDRIEAEQRAENLRDLIGAIVCPIVAEIDADASGQNYIRFMAQAMGHPRLDLVELWRQENSDGLVRTLEMLRAALPDVPDPVFGQRFGLAFEQIVHSLADRERLRSSRDAEFEVGAALFVNNLIDCIAGAMAAPLSAETWRNLEELDSRDPSSA